MADRKGDPLRQPPECKGGSTSCPNLKLVYAGYVGDRYICEVCGESFYVDEDEMR